MIAPRSAVQSAKIDEVVFRHLFGEQERYGVSGPVPPHLKADLARAILFVASGDSVLSEAEMDQLLGRARLYGLEDGELEGLMKVDPKSLTLAQAFPAALQPFARAVLYETITVASADGFVEEERAVADKGGRILGLDAGVVLMLEGFVRVERAVRDMRIRLVTDPGATSTNLRARYVPVLGSTPPGGQTVRERYESVLRRERFGLDGPLPTVYADRVPKAMLVAAAADGRLSESELARFLAACRGMGVSQDVLEHLAGFDASRVQLEPLVAGLPAPLRRIVLYGAVMMSAGDGFAVIERASVRRLADALELEPTLVDLFLQQLQLEEAVRQARLRLVMPPADG